MPNSRAPGFSSNKSKGVDFGRTAQDYRRFRGGFPEEFFDRLARLGIGRAGQIILDLGSGTGTVAREFARRGARVTGVDIAKPLIAQARDLDRQEDITIEYIVSKAESTPLASATFDCISAGQCWHWFDSAKAFAEARRLLKAEGRLLIAHFDWLPLPGSVVAMTEALILKHNPGWKLAGGNGFHTQWAEDATTADFTDIETFTFDKSVPYTHEGWRGRIRASAGVAASLDADKVRAFDAEHAALLDKNFPDDRLTIPHRLFALIARPKSP